MRYFSNFVFMSEKRYALGRQRFLARFVFCPYNCLKNLSAAKCDRKRNQDFANERGSIEPIFFFCIKIVELRPFAEQTDATRTCHRRGPGGGAQLLRDFAVKK